FGLDLGADAGQFELEDVVAHDPEPAIGCPDHGDPAVAPGRDVDRGATPVAQVADAHRLGRLQAGEQLARVAHPQLPAVAEDLDAVYRDHAVAAAQAGLGGAAAGSHAGEPQHAPGGRGQRLQGTLEQGRVGGGG